MKIPIWVVLDDKDIVLDAKGVDIFTTLNAQGTRSRILADAGADRLTWNR